MTSQTLDILPLDFRGVLSSINEAARTVDVVFSTGAPVDRIDGFGQLYQERLSLQPQHVRLDRLNSGAPLLNSHAAISVADVLGTVERGSALVTNGRGLATVRFSRREDVDPIWTDVVDGIIRSISVGYRVYKFEEVVPNDGNTPTRTAVDWEPYELSLVSMPADPGARVRAGASADTNRCEIVTRSFEDTMSIAAGDLMRSCRFEFLKAGVPFPDELRQVFLHRRSDR